MFYVFERTEGDHAVLIADDKTSVSILKAELGSSKIGDVFTSDDGIRFIFDEGETALRKQKAVSLHRSLFDKANKKRP